MYGIYTVKCTRKQLERCTSSFWQWFLRAGRGEAEEGQRISEGGFSFLTLYTSILLELFTVRIIHALLDSFYMGQLDKNLLIISLSYWMWTTPSPAPNPVCRITWALNTWLLNGWINDSSIMPRFLSLHHGLFPTQSSSIRFPCVSSALVWSSQLDSSLHFCASLAPWPTFGWFSPPSSPDPSTADKGYHAQDIDIPPHLTAVHVFWHSCSSAGVPVSDSFCLICLSQV